MASSRVIGESSTFGRLALALLAGVLVFAFLSQLIGGSLPFIEFAIAAAVVYLIAGR